MVQKRPQTAPEVVDGVGKIPRKKSQHGCVFLNAFFHLACLSVGRIHIVASGVYGLGFVLNKANNSYRYFCGNGLGSGMFKFFVLQVGGASLGCRHAYVDGSSAGVWAFMYTVVSLDFRSMC